MLLSWRLPYYDMQVHALNQDEAWFVFSEPPRCWWRKHHLAQLSQSLMVDVSIHLSSSLSPCYLIIFASLSVTATTRRRGITLSEDLHSARQGSGFSGEPSHILSIWLQLGLSEVSQIFRNKLFPELCQFPRVFQDIPPCKSALKLPEHHSLDWTLKWQIV